MVTVRLKGVHKVRMTLADGKSVTYHYAWRGNGAPRLQGAPGSPQYVASYTEAHRARKQPQTGTLRQAICEFKASPEYKKLGDHTLRAYKRQLDQIEERFGSMPLAALNERGSRRHFIKWRDTMADTPRTADYAISTLSRLLAFAVENVLIETNHAEGIGRLHRADKSENIWTADDFAAFERVASPELRWAVRLAAFTGLRQGDLIKMAWGNFDGTSFQVRTSKRGKHVTVPATPACQALMGEIPKRHVVVLTTAKTKAPWTADGLRSSFGKACAAAKVKRTFHDLRRTAATNLIMAGVDETRVAMIMGWEESAVAALKLRYVSRSAVVASVLATIEKGR